MKNRGLFVGAFSISVVLSTLGYFVGLAKGAGIPSERTLAYSGTLTTTDGTLLSGTKKIELRLWDAEEAGSIHCDVTRDAIPLVSGYFQIEMGPDCVNAIHQFANLWSEIIVDDYSLGRTRLSAVPYALEANSVSGGTVDVTSVRASSISIAGKEVISSVNRGDGLIGDGTLSGPLTVDFSKIARKTHNHSSADCHWLGTFDIGTKRGIKSSECEEGEFIAGIKFINSPDRNDALDMWDIKCCKMK